MNLVERVKNSYSSVTPSNVWWRSEQEARVVKDIGADIARRYANRELRLGFDANDVELDFEGLALELLTNRVGPGSVRARERRMAR